MLGRGKETALQANKETSEDRFSRSRHNRLATPNDQDEPNIWISPMIFRRHTQERGEGPPGGETRNINRGGERKGRDRADAGDGGEQLAHRIMFMQACQPSIELGNPRVACRVSRVACRDVGAKFGTQFAR
jgi:hypothetical protein